MSYSGRAWRPHKPGDEDLTATLVEYRKSSAIALQVFLRHKNTPGRAERDIASRAAIAPLLQHITQHSMLHLGLFEDAYL